MRAFFAPNQWLGHLCITVQYSKQLTQSFPHISELICKFVLRRKFQIELAPDLPNVLRQPHWSQFHAPKNIFPKTFSYIIFTGFTLLTD